MAIGLFFCAIFTRRRSGHTHDLAAHAISGFCLDDVIVLSWWRHHLFYKHITKVRLQSCSSKPNILLFYFFSGALLLIWPNVLWATNAVKCESVLSWHPAAVYTSCSHGHVHIVLIGRLNCLCYKKQSQPSIPRICWTAYT